MNYDDVTLNDKVYYLKEAYIAVMDEYELLDYIKYGAEQYNDLYWIKTSMQDLDLEAEYFTLTESGYPKAMSENEINEMFEDYIDIVIEETNFLKDYPKYDEKTNKNVMK